MFLVLANVFFVHPTNVILPIGEPPEPASKRRKVESAIVDTDCDATQRSKKDLIDSLSFDQIDDRFLNIKAGLARTCGWLLQSTKFAEWMNPDKLPQHRGFFWIKGKPGCGKSTLTKFTFMELKKSSREPGLLSFFFNARGTHLEKSTIGLYRSLLVQMLERCSDNQRLWNTASLVHWPSDDQLKTNCEVLKHLLTDTVRILGQEDITVIVDALDECDEDEIRDMIAFFERLGRDAISEGRTFRVFFSSRHYPHITVQRSVEMKLEDQQGHAQDIDRYLTSELRAGRGQQAEHIRREIRDKASGIFMWVVLVVQILNKDFDHGRVRAMQQKLRDIPSDLNELFRSILTRDCQNLDEMKLCLQWILCANRPLRREELYFAILSGTEPEGPFRWDPDEIPTDAMDLFILSSSKGLAEITKSRHHSVQFIHESVRDFLLKENGLGQVWDDLKLNTIGLSHDRLKECCRNYVKSNIVDYLLGSSDLPPDRRVLALATSPEAAEVRKKASLDFPFLAYAVHNILTHADCAHAEGIGQKRFLKEFELGHWSQLNNIIGKFQIRRLPPRVDLLYVLAERNCSNLIDI